MTASIQEQLAERLEFARLTGLHAVLSPGSRCTPAVTGLPALADPGALTVAWSVLDCQGAALDPGSGFLAPRGLAGPRLDVVFRPEVVEAGGAQPAPLLRTVRATVTLAGTGRRGEPAAVTRVLAATVQVLPLRLPTLLAAFRHSDYRFESPEKRRTGAALLLAPHGSPLTSVAEVRNALHHLLLSTRALSGFARFAAFAERVRTLVDALHAHPARHIGLIRADAVPDLSQPAAEVVVPPAHGSFDDALTSLMLDRPHPGPTLAIPTAELAIA